jgi:hypothetical protein
VIALLLGAILTLSFVNSSHKYLVWCLQAGTLSGSGNEMVSKTRSCSFPYGAEASMGQKITLKKHKIANMTRA